MHNPPAKEGNFCDEHGNALKPQVALDCNQHMGYVDKGDRMTNSYSIQRWTRKWAKRIIFHQSDMTTVTVSSFLLLTLCCAKMSHRYF
jgi:hypothetical protein